MRNIRAEHDFKKIPRDGYDPEKDGPEPEFGRVGVRCRLCKEYRRIGVDLETANKTGGCVRPGKKNWKPGDILVVPDDFGEVLESFEGWLKGGRVVTESLGTTGEHTWYFDEVQPWEGPDDDSNA